MINIRPAQPSDASTIVDYQIALAKETEDLRLSPKRVYKGVTAVFEDRKKGTYYIAEDINEPAGCLLTMTEWSDWRNMNFLWVHSVYIIPSHRRRGIFKAFYKYLTNLIGISPNICGLRLYVDKSNIGAQQAYKKMGMTQDNYEMWKWMQE